MQNTRRFVAETCAIAGQTLHPGDAVLVVLAAAVAAAGVGQLLASGARPERLTGQVGDRPSANLRIPIFST